MAYDNIIQAYSLLNVKPGDSPSQIKKEYLKLVGHFHPDKFSYNPAAQAQATEKMKAFNQAYSLIKNAPLSRDDRLDTQKTPYNDDEGQGLSRTPRPVRFIFGAAYVGGLFAVIAYLLGRLFGVENTLTILIGYILVAMVSTAAGIFNTISPNRFVKIANKFFTAAWFLIPLIILLTVMSSPS